MIIEEVDSIHEVAVYFRGLAFKKWKKTNKFLKPGC